MGERGESYREAVGATIRGLRLARGWSLRDLSQASGISVPYLSEIERGRKDPSGAVLAQLAEALDLPLGALLCEIGRAIDASYTPDGAMSARQELRAALEGLPEEDVAEVARFARYLRWCREQDSG